MRVLPAPPSKGVGAPHQCSRVHEKRSGSERVVTGNVQKGFHWQSAGEGLMVVFVHIQVDGAENNIGDANKEEGEEC